MPSLLATSVMLTITAASATALANPLELGAGVGLTQSSQDASNSESSRQIDALYLRVGVFGPLSLQGELGSTDASGGNVHSLTGAAVLELGRHRWVPYLLAGVGADSTTSSSTSPRAEAGVGLEYRTQSGLAIGVDVREGYRPSAPQPPLYIDPPSNNPPIGGGAGGGTSRLIPPDASAPDGQFRTARVTIGIAF